MTSVIDEIESQIAALSQDPIVDETATPEDHQLEGVVMDLDEHISMIDRLHCDGCELFDGVTQITSFMMEHRGVNQQLAQQIEMLIPGAISEKRSLRSYTQEFTKTNYEVTMEEMSSRQKQLSAGGVFILLVALYKLFTWLREKIRALFGKDDDIKNRLTAVKDTAKETEKKLTSVSADVVKQIKQSEKGVKHFAQLCQELNVEVTPLQIDPVKAVNELNQKYYEHCMKGLWNKYTETVFKANSQPKTLEAAITFVVENVPHMKEKLQKFSDDMKNDGALEFETYRFDFRGAKEFLALCSKTYRTEASDKDLHDAKFSSAMKECKDTMKAEGSESSKELPQLKDIIETDWKLEIFDGVGKAIDGALNNTPEMMKRLQGEADAVPDDQKDNRKLVMGAITDDWHALVHATEIVSWHYLCMTKVIKGIEQTVTKQAHVVEKWHGWVDKK